MPPFVHSPAPPLQPLLHYFLRQRAPSGRVRVRKSSVLTDKKGRRIGIAIALACSVYLAGAFLADNFYNGAMQRQVTLDLLQSTSSSPKTASPNTVARVDTRPPLSLRDFQIDEYYNSGSVNDVCLVRFREPHVAHAYGLADANQTVVLKLVYNKQTAGNGEEIVSLSRFAAVDDATAERLHLIRAIWMQRDAPNPYFCTKAEAVYDVDEDDDHAVRFDDHRDCVVKEKSLELPAFITGQYRERFRAHRHLDVIVLPFVKNVKITETVETFRDVKVFFRSYLQVLEVAHAHQVNNGDLQVLRNIFVNTTTGQAILFDWNGLLEMGDNPYRPDQSSRYAPPEAFIEKWWGIRTRITHFHAMDIYQVGIGLAHLMYHPCAWQSSKKLKKDKKWLAKLILALGGNTVIPVNETATVDLAMLAGLSPGAVPKVITNQNFRPLLDGGSDKLPCTKPSWYMNDPNISQADKDLAVDFLRRMLVLSPAERPTATELLRHAFFHELDDDKTTRTTVQ